MSSSRLHMPEDASLEDVMSWNQLAATLVSSTSAAARDAIDEQFALLVPKVMQQMQEVAGTRDRAQTLTLEHLESGACAAKSSKSDMSKNASFANLDSTRTTSVRDLEEALATRVLDQHGFGQTPSPSSAASRKIRPSTLSPSSARRKTFVPSPWVGDDVVCAPPTLHLVEMKGAVSDASSRGEDPPRMSDIDSQMPQLSDERQLSSASGAAAGLTLAKTRQQVMQDRATELARSFETDGVDAVLSNRAETGLQQPQPQEIPHPALFHICGFSRSSSWSKLYHMVLILLSVSALLVFSFDYFGARAAATSLRVDCEGGALSQACSRPKGLLSTLPLAAALVSFLIVPFLFPKNANIRGTLGLLASYTRTYNLFSRWDKRARTDAWLTLFVGMAAILAMIFDMLLSDEWSERSDRGGVHMACTVVLVGLCVGWTQCMLCMCRALSAMVDHYCCHMTLFPDTCRAMDEWNVLQAVLLKASGTMQWSFVSLLVAMGFTVPLLLADFLALGARVAAIPTVAPVCLLTMLIMRVFFVAGSISDRCTRVPALVDSLSFGEGMESRRHLLTEYILHSDAGFYVCDVRLTMGMAVKFMYMWSVVGFGMAANLIAYPD